MSIRSILSFAAALVLAACASAPAPLDSDEVAAEDAVAQRAVERWEHLIAGRTEEAWEYLSPGSREVLNRDGYVKNMRSRPVRWLSADISSVSCEEDVCNVVLNLEIETRMPGAGRVRSPGVVRERWIRSDRQWYYVPRATS